MKTPFAAIAILIALALPVLADDGPPTLSASGQGVENAAPDIAILTLGVLSRANTARAALDANNADMNRVIATIRAESVSDITAIACVGAAAERDGSRRSRKTPCGPGLLSGPTPSAAPRESSGSSSTGGGFGSRVG